MSEMTEWEITDGRTVYNDDFVKSAEIIKEFSGLTKDVSLQKGKQKSKLLMFFNNNERRAKHGCNFNITWRSCFN